MRKTIFCTTHPKDKIRLRKSTGNKVQIDIEEFPENKVCVSHNIKSVVLNKTRLVQLRDALNKAIGELSEVS